MIVEQPFKDATDIVQSDRATVETVGPVLTMLRFELQLISVRLFHAFHLDHKNVQDD